MRQLLPPLAQPRLGRRHVNASGGLRLFPLWDICIRFVTPGILLIILTGALLTGFSAAYGGYPVQALLFIGGGILFFTWLGAFILSHVPWKPEKMKTEHKPDEEHLLT